MSKKSSSGIGKHSTGDTDTESSTRCQTSDRQTRHISRTHRCYTSEIQEIGVEDNELWPSLDVKGSMTPK